MLHDQHIQIDIGRADGGDFVRVTHIPTGIFRLERPLLGTGKQCHQKKQRMLEEIEEELLSKGLTEYTWQPATRT